MAPVRHANAARKHLEKAINLYDEVIKEKPDHLIAQLGRAWCIAQRGKKEDAIKEYRKVIALAWEKEKDLKVAPLGWHAITAETIAPSVGKKHLRMRPLGFIQPVFQYGPRLLGRWGTSLLPSFPCTAHMSACIDHDILSLQARQLR